MEHRCLRVVLSLCFAVCFFAPAVGSATITESALKKKVVITEEAALLQQVDTVSLYLSSNKIAFAPRLAGGVIEVETTVLAPELIAHRAKAKEFVTRTIGTFISVLKERLPIYAPDIAARFDPAKDIAFHVNSGTSRTPLGAWKGGAWEDAVAVAPKAAPAAATPAVVEPAAAGAPPAGKAFAQKSAVKEEEIKEVKPGPKGCACPARR